jgi:hypothetical protein
MLLAVPVQLAARLTCVATNACSRSRQSPQAGTVGAERMRRLVISNPCFDSSCSRARSLKPKTWYGGQVGWRL